MAELTEKRIQTEKKILVKLQSLLTDTKDENLYHINVYKIADRFGIRRDIMLGAFIRGVTEGIFTMAWMYHCPSCGGISTETLKIHEATHENYCGNCKINFNNVLDGTIEVFFTVHPEYKNISSKYNDDYYNSITESLKDGGHFFWYSEYIIHGTDIINNPTYRELMNDDVLLEDQSLEIQNICILFTDIKGSTDLYSRLGDAKAFQLVREHFRILFSTIEEFGGTPIKTIGDAVMGVFYSKSVAVECSLEAQKRLQEFYTSKPEETKIEVKMGIHNGTTIVVNLNNRLDYFGNTVNTAARIQGVAKPNEIVLSENVFEKKEVQLVLTKYKAVVSKDKTPFKGLKGNYTIFRVNLN